MKEMNENLIMENKYKVGDKLYFGYFTGSDIKVEEHIVTQVFPNNSIEIRNTVSNSLGHVGFPWIDEPAYFDTYEEAFNYTIERVRANFSYKLDNAEKALFNVKDKIKKFEDKYGKRNEKSNR
jgi:hypothetical protein